MKYRVQGAKEKKLCEDIEKKREMAILTDLLDYDGNVNIK